MKFRILNTGAASAKNNMEEDLRLLESLKDSDEPILHLYDWQGDAATYGYFIDPLKLFSEKGIKNHRLDIAKRPTGGGVVFHNQDLAFSVLIPKHSKAFSPIPLETYAYVHEKVRRAIDRFCQKSSTLLSEEKAAPTSTLVSSFCMAKPSRYDLLIDGKKVAGAAQRRGPYGLLHQGSIFLRVAPRSFFEEVLLDPEPIWAEMERSSSGLLSDDHGVDLKEARRELSFFLQEAFS